MADIEQLRINLKQKIDQHLEAEQSFGGARYTGLDLSPTDFSQWRDRPLIQGATEPFTPREDIRIILTDHLAQGEIDAYKTMQLHITPIEEAARVKYVYNLKLSMESSAELVTYIDKPAYPQIGDEPAPMLPYNMTSVKTTPLVFRAFNDFLDKARSMPKS